MFENKTEMRFIGIETKQKKDGSGTYQTINFFNPDKYEKIDFFLTTDVNVQGLQQNDKVTLQVELVKQGWNVVPRLISVQKATVKV